MADIPKYIKYDFLITFLGLLCTGSAWYFSSLADVNSSSINLLLLIGIPLTIWGLTEMYRNYADEQDMKQLNMILEKKEALDKLVNQNIISKDVKEDFIKYLKGEFEEVFEKSKKRKEKDKLPKE
ncbi:MAG: hypothetical protein Q8N99_06345 [Nanoarchaeota archaeon]|nr:hypothetical protein [Nanoarchaeota archaeon]